MKNNITKLTVAEITELQPTETLNASGHGWVMGGLEVSGEIDHDALGASVTKHFGASAAYHGEGIDGDDCVHFVVISTIATQAA